MGVMHRFICRAARVFAALTSVAILVSLQSVSAQDELFNQEAEAVFREGLELFEQGFYGSAFTRFERVHSDYSLNRKTTAAWLMAGKSLYRHGEYSRAVDILSHFIREFPASSYIADAERTRRFAIESMEAERRRGRLVQIGVALPMDGESATLTQSMFNGIRLAVEEHNSSGGGQMPVRLVFRDSGNRGEIAADAVEALVQQKVDVIVGPLYSEEARGAAGVAEVNGVPLIAPLATDEDVSLGRTYVFQANPTISMRGRLMARFAVRSLRLNEFGIVSDFANDYSERMAEAFEDELFRLGAEVAFVQLLPGPSSWFRLLDYVRPDTLVYARAVYLPITGSEAPALIRAALNEINRADIPLRILGNKEWQDVGAPQTASKFSATYTNDFYVDHSLAATQVFIERFRALSGEDPTLLSYSGYDVTRYILLQLTAHAGKPLYQAFRDAPPYQGLGMRFDFRGGNVNEAIYFHRYKDGAAELLR